MIEIKFKQLFTFMLIKQESKLIKNQANYQYKRETEREEKEKITHKFYGCYFQHLVPRSKKIKNTQ